MRAKTMLLMAFAVVMTLAGSACGSDDDNPDVTGSGGLTVVAENTKFSPADIRVAAGEEVTLELHNRDAFEHDLQVDGLDVEVIAGGSDRAEHGGGGHGADGVLAIHTEGEETMSITFIADTTGIYEFYCTIPGHKDSGMVGTLTVE